ncbi:MAG: CPBP family intramembrane glutamic endopeptidase [Leptospirales bacterium]
MSLAPQSKSQDLPPLRADFAGDRRGRALAVLAALLLIFIAPYAFRIPWRFAWASLLLILCAAACYRGGALRLLGLRVGPAQAGAALGLGLIVWWGATLTVADLAERRTIRFVPFDSIELLFGKPFFQSFNEEMILRALLLGLFAAYRPALLHARGPRSWILPGLAALIFSALHWFYYNWLSDVGLRPGTLLSLFLVAFALNSFYLRAGHIFFGVAIHAGWNLVRFGGRFYTGDPQTGGLEYLRYAHTFDLLEGDPGVLGAAGVLAGVGAVLLWRAPRAVESPPIPPDEPPGRS